MQDFFNFDFIIYEIKNYRITSIFIQDLFLNIHNCLNKRNIKMINFNPYRYNIPFCFFSNY